MTYLSWVVDDNCFHIESDYNALSHDKARKCIAVAEMIISLHKNNFTPFNLGLALQLCHGYGSKHLIETLNAFGICASYTEVRQLLTSVANHEIAKTEVSCIPYGIRHTTLDSDFIQEGADNIDLNTETIDRLFEIRFHFAGHRSSSQEFSAGPSEFLPDLHFVCKIERQDVDCIQRYATIYSRT